MNTKLKVTQGITAVLALLVLAQPAHADWRHNDHDRDDRHSRRHYRSVNYHHSYPRNSIVFHLPHTFISLSFGNSRYFYCDGIYYRRAFGYYESVRPPIGVIVNVLPSDYEQVVIRGRPYFLCNGIYYKNAGHQYIVVNDPNEYGSDDDVAVVRPRSDNNYQSITLNIPNNKGGYTAVTLKRSGRGFIGPQGELYEEFPTVDQLKIVYGK